MRIHTAGSISLLWLGALGWAACSSEEARDPSHDSQGGGNVEVEGGADGDEDEAGGASPRGGASVTGGKGGSGGSDVDQPTTPGGGGGASGATAADDGGSASVQEEEPDPTPGRSCTPDSLYEPNDSAGNPCWIEANAAVASALAAGDTDDYYSIDLKKGVTYTLDLFISTSLQRGISLTVGDKVQPLIEHGTEFTGVTHREFTAPTSGRALFRLNGAAQYHFTIWDERVKHDVNFEPNNSPSLAAPIATGQHIDEALTSAEDDYDYYELEVASGVTYTFDFFHPQSLNRKVSQVVAGQSYTYLEDQPVYSTSTHEEVTARANGTLLLGLRGLGGYQFSFTAENPDHDSVTHEPNNSPSTAAPLALGATATSDLGTLVGDNVDYFAVPVKANKAYILHLEHTGSLSRAVTLLKSSYVVKASSTIFAATLDERLTTLAQDDQLLVRLEGSGTYELSVAAE